MIIIDLFTFFFFLFIFIVLFLVITHGCLNSYKKSIKLGKKGFWIWRNQKQIILWNGVIFLTCFVTILITRIVISNIDLSSLEAKINCCDMLIIKNHYVDQEQGYSGQEEFTVTEPEIIKLFANLISNSPYIRVLNRSLYYNQDYIEIYLYDKDKEIGNLILTYTNLANYGFFGEQVYRCNSVIDLEEEFLLMRVRDILKTIQIEE